MRLTIIALLIAIGITVSGCTLSPVDDEGYSETNPKPVLELVPSEAENVVELMPDVAMYEVNGKCFVIDNTWNQPELESCKRYFK